VRRSGDRLEGELSTAPSYGIWAARNCFWGPRNIRSMDSLYKLFVAVAALSRTASFCFKKFQFQASPKRLTEFQFLQTC
jgi:hypothetical protein